MSRVTSALLLVFRLHDSCSHVWWSNKKMGVRCTLIFQFGMLLTVSTLISTEWSHASAQWKIRSLKFGNNLQSSFCSHRASQSSTVTFTRSVKLWTKFYDPNWRDSANRQDPHLLEPHLGRRNGPASDVLYCISATTYRGLGKCATKLEMNPNYVEPTQCVSRAHKVVQTLLPASDAIGYSER